MQNIQLQNNRLCDMRLRIPHCRAAVPIGLCIPGNRHGEQQNLRDLPLNRLEQFVRHRQIADTAAFLGKLHNAIVLSQLVAYCVQLLCAEAKIFFKGGKLPVYDQRTPLPSVLEQYNDVWRAAQGYSGSTRKCAEIPQAVRLSAANTANGCSPAATRRRRRQKSAKAIVPVVL